MANPLFDPTLQVIASSGSPVSGATLSFFVAGTTTPARAYANADLSGAQYTSLTSNSLGRFSAVYGDPAVAYKINLSYGAVSLTVDPWVSIAGDVTTTALDSITALRAKTWTAAEAPDLVMVLYNWEAGDGGGVFRLDAADTTSSDDGGVVVLTSTSGTALRYKRQFSGPVHLTWYTAGGAAVNARSAMQAWMDYCFSSGHVAYVPAGKKVFAAGENGSNGYCILNEGVSVVFEEAPTDYNSRFIWLSGTASTVDFMKVRPRQNYTIDELTFRHVYIDPNYGGTKRGKRGMYFSFDQFCTANNTVLDHCRVNEGNNYSVEFYSDDAQNPQGIPFGLQIIGGNYYEGIKAAGVSDSFQIGQGLFIRTSAASSRIGLDLQCVSASGATIGRGLVYNINIDADGGAIKVRSGGGVELRTINAEQSTGAATAVIDISGDDLTMAGCLIDGVSVGVYGTASVTSLIRLDACKFPKLDNYKLITAATGGGFTAPTNGVLITSNCSDADIGDGEIAVEAGRLTNGVNDSGVGTRGVIKTPTYANSWVDASGTEGSSFVKGHDGTVTINLAVDSGTATPGTAIFTLPSGFRPSFDTWASVVSHSGGVYELGAVKVTASTGVVSIQDGANGLLAGVITFLTPPYVVGYD